MRTQCVEAWDLRGTTAGCNARFGNGVDVPVCNRYSVVGRQLLWAVQSFQPYSLNQRGSFPPECSLCMGLAISGFSDVALEWRTEPIAAAFVE